MNFYPQDRRRDQKRRAATRRHADLGFISRLECERHPVVFWCQEMVKTLIINLFPTGMNDTVQIGTFFA